VRERREELVLAAVLLAELGDIDGHAVEVRGRAVGCIGGAAERADVLHGVARRIARSIHDIVGRALRDRCLDGGARSLAVLGMHALVERLDRDVRIGRQPEVRLRSLVPEEIRERQIAIPEPDAREANGVVEPCAALRERAIGGDARADIARDRELDETVTVG
jgi:hypothetical protein